MLKKIFNFWKPYTLGFVKELLLLWLFSLIWLSSFCSAWEIVYSWHYVRANASSNRYYANSNFFAIPSPYYDIHNYSLDFDCSITNYEYSVWDIFADFTPTFKFYLYTNSSSLSNINLTTFSFNNWEASFSWTVPSFYGGSAFVGSNFAISNTATLDPTVCVAWSNCSYSFDFVCVFSSDWISSSSSCDTWAILSWYILESDVNTWYCVSNNLCPSCPVIDQEYCENNFNLIDPQNCPSSPSGSWSSWSAVWINNIQHLGASNIFMSIPEEISRDYTYVDSGSSMEIDVEGYNVDYDYINWIIETQNSKPSSEDFNDIITRVLPLFVPWLVIILFIYFVFKFIKKMF